MKTFFKYQLILTTFFISLSLFICCRSTKNEVIEEPSYSLPSLVQIGPDEFEIDSKDLLTAIQYFRTGTYTFYKVYGNMSNDDYNDISRTMNWKRRDLNWQSYVSLDLSQVTGLTYIEGTWDWISLIIPTSVTKFGEDSRLFNVKISEDNNNFINENAVLYSKDKSILYLYSPEKTDKTFNIPSSVTKIWSYAFADNQYIRNIYVPGSVLYIGTDAFMNPNIQTLKFEDKENWIAHHNFDSTILNVRPEDLEIVQNYLISQITFGPELLQDSKLYKPGYESIINNQAVAQVTKETKQEKTDHEKKINLPAEVSKNRLSVKSVEGGVEITIDTRGLDDWRDSDGWLIERNSGIRVQFIKRDIVTFIYPFTEPGTAANFWVINTDDSIQIMPTSGIGNPMKKLFQETKIETTYDKTENEFYGYINSKAKSADDLFNTAYALNNKYIVYLEFYVRAVKYNSTAAAYAAIGFNKPAGLFPDWLKNRADYYSFEEINTKKFKTNFYNSMNLNEYDSYYAELQVRYEDVDYEKDQRVTFYISGPISDTKYF